MKPRLVLPTDSVTRRHPTFSSADVDNGGIFIIPTAQSIARSRSRSLERKSHDKPSSSAADATTCTATTRRSRKHRRLATRRIKPITYLACLVLLLLLVMWCGFQWKAYLILQDGSGPSKIHLPGEKWMPEKIDLFDHENSIHENNPRLRFLIFHEMGVGQGVGNNLHGLLAAHLVGDEFDRIVCVSPDFEGFHIAFESIHPLAVEHCPAILKKHNRSPPETRPEHTIYLFNFRDPPNECHLKEKLASHRRVLHMQSNTYPRWPRVEQDNLFFQFYKAKPDLLAVLPYPPHEPPKTVVHLRQPDTGGTGDARFGVDFGSLRALGNYMKSKPYKPYVVTNNVAWFDMYEKDFGWHHPHWRAVKHSALGIEWDARHEQSDPEEQYSEIKSKYTPEFWEQLKLYADWYALLTAEEVYHTYSDFSLSAVHWSNKWSRTYDGISKETGELIFVKENWIVDGETPRLIYRSNGELRLCDQHIADVDT